MSSNSLSFQGQDAHTLNNRVASRYGINPKKPTKAIAIIATVLLTILITWIVLTVSFSSWSKVSGQVMSYNIVSNSEVEANIIVTAPKNTDIACAVEANSKSHGQVAWKVVTFESVDSSQIKDKIKLKTISKAISTEIESCWIIK